MKWIRQLADDYELFWHITSKDRVKSTKKGGLVQSVNGIYGDGVYCIKKDANKLDDASNFMERNGLSKKDQCIVEFEFRGEYDFCDCGSGIYEEHGWIVIRKEISPKYIERIVPFTSYRLLLF